MRVRYCSFLVAEVLAVMDPQTLAFTLTRFPDQDPTHPTDRRRLDGLLYPLCGRVAETLRKTPPGGLYSAFASNHHDRPLASPRSPGLKRSRWKRRAYRKAFLSGRWLENVNSSYLVDIG